MSSLAKRATVYLEPRLHKALQLQAIETSRSVSDLINDAVRAELTEDAEDLETFEKRTKEKSVDFESFLKVLKRDGVL